MVSARPRSRHPLRLPTPTSHTSLQRTLSIALLVTTAAWTLPALLLPSPWFAALGLASEAHVLFVRLLGTAYAGLLVGYLLAWQAPNRHPVVVLMGAVTNGLGAMVIAAAGARGAFGPWNGLTTLYGVASACGMAALAAALVATGHPLIRRMGGTPPTDRFSESRASAGRHPKG